MPFHSGKPITKEVILDKEIALSHIRLFKEFFINSSTKVHEGLMAITYSFIPGVKKVSLYFSIIQLDSTWTMEMR